jgi:hypothetical protein
MGGGVDTREEEDLAVGEAARRFWRMQARAYGN